MGGFIFDYATAGEVDDAFMLGQQIFYLLLIAMILIAENYSNFHWVKKIEKNVLWKYRVFLLHFGLGSILNIYSFFFLKSASAANSIIFFVLLLAVVIGNELPAVQKSGLDLKWGLWTLCLICFFSIVYPLLLGFVGWTPMILSVLSSLLVLYGLYKILLKNTHKIHELRTQFLVPNAVVIGGFVVLFVLGLIPPVPLAAKDLGIYHALEKKDGKYLLSYENPWWRFWNTADENFLWRDGDQIVFFTRIFSPGQIKDQITIHWLFYTRNGWQTSDKVPLQFSGGRKEGFRGFAVKKNITEGDWRVQVETTDGREIGRSYFKVKKDSSQEVREFKIREM